MRTRSQILSSVFRQGQTGYFQPGETLIAAGELPTYVYQLRTGLAYQSTRFPDGRRAIIDIFAPGNVVGLETILSLRASGSVAAAGPIKYFAVDAHSLHQLLEDREIACVLPLSSLKRADGPKSCRHGLPASKQPSALPRC
jgi:CRP-like cAMP-binding protein